MEPRILVVNDSLSLATDGVVTADASGGTVPETVMKYTVPDGEVLGIPKFLLPILELNSAAGTKCTRYSKWGLGLITSGDLDRVVPIGPRMIPWTAWYDTLVALQRDEDHRKALTVDLTKIAPMIVFNQDETFVFQVISSAGLDVSESLIEIPCYRGKATRVEAELAARYAEIAR